MAESEKNMKVIYNRPRRREMLKSEDYPNRTLAYSEVFRSVMLNVREGDITGWLSFSTYVLGSDYGLTRRIHGHVLDAGTTVTLVQEDKG